MNILIAAIYSYNSYSRGIMPDVLQSQLDENPGATIYYLTNSNTFDVCYFNINKRPEICYLCKTGVKNTLEMINGKFVHLRISDIIQKSDYERAKEFFKEDPEINGSLIFENFEVGEAVLSTYISRTRDRDLLEIKRPFVNELAINAVALYLATQRFLKEKEIEVVYNFNGRQDYVRAIMRAAATIAIDCYNLERTRLKGHIDYYKNTLPHDVHYKFHLVQKYWEESELSEEEKKAIAAEFYARQRSGESVIYPSYTGKMEKGVLPHQINNGKKNIVVFNSSDDEVAAFGKLYKNPLFENQIEGLRYLSNLIGKELSSYNLIIRMHPNLRGVSWGYVDEIRQLDQKFDNIFVIEPESNIDTYALMGISDKVISFGSTTGLEANFMRKPVMLLGKCRYYYADVAYVPKSLDEINTLLSQELKPKPILDTLKFGFYYQQGGVETKYYYESKIGEGIYFKKKRIHFYTFTQRLKAKITQLVYNYLGMRLKLKS